MKKKKPGNDYDDFSLTKKPAKKDKSPMVGRRESPGMGKKGGGKSPSSGRCVLNGVEIPLSSISLIMRNNLYHNNLS